MFKKRKKTSLGKLKPEKINYTQEKRGNPKKKGVMMISFKKLQQNMIDAEALGWCNQINWLITFSFSEESQTTI